MLDKTPHFPVAQCLATILSLQVRVRGHEAGSRRRGAAGPGGLVTTPGCAPSPCPERSRFRVESQLSIWTSCLRILCHGRAGVFTPFPSRAKERQHWLWPLGAPGTTGGAPTVRQPFPHPQTRAVSLHQARQRGVDTGLVHVGGRTLPGRKALAR